MSCVRPAWLGRGQYLGTLSHTVLTQDARLVYTYDASTSISLGGANTWALWASPRACRQAAWRCCSGRASGRCWRRRRPCGRAGRRWSARPARPAGHTCAADSLRTLRGRWSCSLGDTDGMGQGSGGDGRLGGGGWMRIAILRRRHHHQFNSPAESDHKQTPSTACQIDLTSGLPAHLDDCRPKWTVFMHTVHLVARMFSTWTSLPGEQVRQQQVNMSVATRCTAWCNQCSSWSWKTTGRTNLHKLIFIVNPRWRRYPTRIATWCTKIAPPFALIGRFLQLQAQNNADESPKKPKGSRKMTGRWKNDRTLNKTTGRCALSFRPSENPGNLETEKPSAPCVSKCAATQSETRCK